MIEFLIESLQLKEQMTKVTQLEEVWKTVSNSASSVRDVTTDFNIRSKHRDLVAACRVSSNMH